MNEVYSMDSGKKRRLKKVMPDNRTVIVPMDHGVTCGPIKGLENMSKTIERLEKGGCDAIVVHKGIAKTVETPHRIGLIIHLSASTNIADNPNLKVSVGTVKEAIRLGCDAVSVHINIGSKGEVQMLQQLGEIAGDCDKYGIPLLAMMYPRGPKIKNEHDPAAVAHAARLGAELGADIIKTNYTGNLETFRSVVESCPVPVILAGGPKAPQLKDFFTMVYDSLQAGGAGVSIGRNVFQHEHSDQIVSALSALIHQNRPIEEVYKRFQEVDVINP
jgi:fructose-bisphosphate aldolase/2-amino-3,7-dideoxy-D-threo-hept-6-ulosonate synthase